MIEDFIIPKKGKFVIQFKDQQNWNKALRQLGSDTPSIVGNFRAHTGTSDNINDTMSVIDGRYDGYCDFVYYDTHAGFSKKEWVFLEVEENGYMHRWGSPNYSYYDDPFNTPEIIML